MSLSLSLSLSLIYHLHNARNRLGMNRMNVAASLSIVQRTFPWTPRSTLRRHQDGMAGCDSQPANQGGHARHYGLTSPFLHMELAAGGGREGGREEKPRDGKPVLFISEGISGYGRRLDVCMARSLHV